jgi:hypothetical protein
MAISISAISSTTFAAAIAATTTITTAAIVAWLPLDAVGDAGVVEHCEVRVQLFRF